MTDYTESNRSHWNARTAVNAVRYDIEGFKAGKTSLGPIELEELGDVSGKSLLHLQCHFGLDTLSWARLGAQVTGVDFSEDAISLAERLTVETGLDARFLCTDIYELPLVLDEQFDIVYTSGGVLFWLADLDKWAKIVARFLKPGGVFYLQEEHPFVNVYDDSPHVMDLRTKYPYFHTEQPIQIEGLMPYSDPVANQRSVEFVWSFSFSDILNALIAAGLRLDYLHEFSHSSNKRFPFMSQGGDGWWRWNDSDNHIPLTFSLQATKG
ncbi:bifunctional 2-polyprenyl-6-hydroxyphenol methylase/3-demethylubiquinol 3-O-methyltransferase UbiG [Paenibacillus sp. CF384]|uniref:class I SAM-dependent methyltransferase n=1 Tax=Paenibacillus sp. CF384 TaxID=1884382 RepID=UPI000894AACC|nr:class I SAM-dependent methyltransferase [Paenibacillus sp. CF384]SDW03193.1 Methyltransferase domain-containing protein [Paenibacillus sp. CF384]